MADGPLMQVPPALLDYQGERGEVTWVTREKTLAAEVAYLREEITFLREMLGLALAQNTERGQNT